MHVDCQGHLPLHLSPRLPRVLLTLPVPMPVPVQVLLVLQLQLLLPSLLLRVLVLGSTPNTRLPLRLQVMHCFTLDEHVPKSPARTETTTTILLAATRRRRQ